MSSLRALLDKPIKAWYQKSHSYDEYGQYIDESATFYGVLACIASHQDVYQYIGITDSAVRERVFDGIHCMSGIPYEDIYNAWLES